MSIARSIVNVSWSEYLREALLGPAASAALLFAIAFFYLSTWRLMSEDDRDLLRRFTR